MADTNILQSINIGGKRFSVPACWEELGLTKAYMLALLSRDEYTPTVDHKPTETDTIYTDPDSGNPAGFHAGQCVIYPDVEALDGIGMSVAKQVTVNEQGVPTNIVWLHLGDIDKHSKWINDIANTRFSELTDGVGSLRSDVSDLKTKGTTTDNNLANLETEHTTTREALNILGNKHLRLESEVADLETKNTTIDNNLSALETKHSQTQAFVFKNQQDIAALTPKVEALESSGCFIAYWPSLSDKQYCAATLDEWPKIKKGNSEVVALGILVVPDMGEPFIVSLTEGSSKWASSVKQVYPDCISTELSAHFNQTVSAHNRMVNLVAVGGTYCTAAQYCIDHHCAIKGTSDLAWVLPDLKIMMTIKKYLSQINKCLSVFDGSDTLCGSGDNYWTGNEKSSSQAVVINLANGLIKGTTKLQTYRIRPVGFLEF